MQDLRQTGVMSDGLPSLGLPSLSPFMLVALVGLSTPPPASGPPASSFLHCHARALALAFLRTEYIKITVTVLTECLLSASPGARVLNIFFCETLSIALPVGFITTISKMRFGAVRWPARDPGRGRVWTQALLAPRSCSSYPIMKFPPLCPDI